MAAAAPDYRVNLIHQACDNMRQGDTLSMQKAARELSTVLSLSPQYLPALVGLHYLLFQCAFRMDQALIMGCVRWSLSQLSEEITAKMKLEEAKRLDEIALCALLEKEYAIPLAHQFSMIETALKAAPVAAATKLDPLHLWAEIDCLFTEGDFKSAAEQVGQLLTLPPDPLCVVAIHLFLRCDELFPYLDPGLLYPYQEALEDAMNKNEAAFAAILENPEQRALLSARLARLEDGPFKRALTAEMDVKNKDKNLEVVYGSLRPYIKSHPYLKYLYAQLLMQAKAEKSIPADRVEPLQILLRNLLESSGKVIGSAKAEYGKLCLEEETHEGVNRGIQAIREAMLLGSDRAAYELGQALMTCEGTAEDTEEGVYCLLNAANSIALKAKRVELLEVAHKALQRGAGVSALVKTDHLLTRMRALRDQDSPRPESGAEVSPAYALCLEALALFQNPAERTPEKTAQAAAKLVAAIGEKPPYYLPALLMYQSLLYTEPRHIKTYPIWGFDQLDQAIHDQVQSVFEAGEELNIFNGFEFSPFTQYLRLRAMDCMCFDAWSPEQSHRLKLKIWQEVPSAEETDSLFKYYLASRFHAKGDKESATRLCQEAADAGLPVAYHAMAQICENNGNEKAAYRYYSRAAEHNLPAALFAMSARHTTGAHGFDKNFELAVGLCYQAAQLGHQGAQKELESLEAVKGEMPAASQVAPLTAAQRSPTRHRLKDRLAARQAAACEGAGAGAAEPVVAAIQASGVALKTVDEIMAELDESSAVGAAAKGKKKKPRHPKEARDTSKASPAAALAVPRSSEKPARKVALNSGSVAPVALQAGARPAADSVRLGAVAAAATEAVRVAAEAEKMDGPRRENAVLRGEISALSAQLDAAKTESAASKKKITRLQEARAVLRDQVKALKAQLAATQTAKEGVIRGLQAEAAELQEQISGLRPEVERLQAENAESKRQASETENLRDCNAVLRGKMRELEARLAASATDKDTLARAVARIAALQADLRCAQARVTALAEAQGAAPVSALVVFHHDAGAASDIGIRR